MMKRYKIIFCMMVFFGVIIFIILNNIELNRSIYCNDVHIKVSEERSRNESNDYNLDDMEKHLDNLENKSKSKNSSKDNFDMLSRVYVPKFRILYSENPFDIRFETLHYKIYINKSIEDYAEREKSILFCKLDEYYKDINNYMDDITAYIGIFKIKLLGFIHRVY
ncbi:membrane protein [Clostridium acetobutylicum]|nr:membrane protein [Clostridium acetobutylicum]